MATKRPYDPSRCEHCGALDGIRACVQDGVCRQCALELWASAREAAFWRRVNEQLDERLGK